MRLCLEGSRALSLTAWTLANSRMESRLKNSRWRSLATTTRRRTRSRRLLCWKVASRLMGRQQQQSDNARLNITFSCDVCNDECQTVEELEAHKNSHLVKGDNVMVPVPDVPCLTWTGRRSMRSDCTPSSLRNSAMANSSFGQGTF